MADIGKIEYRVRETTRYIITRYHEDVDGEAGVDTKGEYDSHHVAYEVAYALCKAEHDRLGYEIGDERISYPRHPDKPFPPIGSGGAAKMVVGSLSGR